ncbi:MAG: translation initiation factor IF-5A [Candidatus Marsarchaeota archaeon]|jgi:translation initiation factor 5A|nr:translation initiation factor IF-5A [Candidatus Marsarchaeota archaeon]MCL5418328.1 translation initiation factor IF-5A [Candidatus Marsarchaeota archaeon]
MVEEGKTIISMKDVKVGRFIIIDDIPCRVVDIETSSPGKHGSAKMRVTAIGIFDGQKKTLLKPSDAETEAPVIKKAKSQVVSVKGDVAQLMDTETYDVFELPIPPDLAGKVNAGAEVEVLEAMGRRILSRILS